MSRSRREIAAPEAGGAQQRRHGRHAAELEGLEEGRRLAADAGVVPAQVLAGVELLRPRQRLGLLDARAEPLPGDHRLQAVAVRTDSRLRVRNGTGGSYDGGRWAAHVSGASERSGFVISRLPGQIRASAPPLFDKSDCS